MLYKGSQAKYTYEIAQHEAHEDELREQGWIGFYDLPEQGESEKVGEIYSTDLKASDEALVEAKAEIETTEQHHRQRYARKHRATQADSI